MSVWRSLIRVIVTTKDKVDYFDRLNSTMEQWGNWSLRARTKEKSDIYFDITILHSQIINFVSCANKPSHYRRIRVKNRRSSKHPVSCYSEIKQTHTGIILMNLLNLEKFHSLFIAKRGKRWISCIMKMEQSASTSAKRTSSTKSSPMDLRMMLLSCQIFRCWAQPHKVNTLLGKSNFPLWSTYSGYMENIHSLSLQHD